MVVLGCLNCVFEPKKNIYLFVFVLLSSFTKNENVKSCLCCGKRTYSKLQICNRCDGDNLRAKITYYVVVKPFRMECK